MKKGLHTLWVLITRNATLKIFSVIFAAGLWVLVNAGERDTEMSLTVPLEWRNLPPHLVVVGQHVDSVDVRVVGPRTLLGLLHQKKILLDLSGMHPGPSSFRIGKDQLSLPRGIELVRISPSQINLEIARIQKRRLPVSLDVLGEPPAGYKLGEIEVVPNAVEVTGPAPALARLQSVPTEPLQLSRFTQSGTLDLDLVSPHDGLISYNLQQVRVRIDIQDVMVSRTFQKIKCTVRNTEFAADVSPASVDVEIHGPQRLVEPLQLSAQEVFADAAGQEPGTVILPVTVLVPPGVTIVRQEPKVVVVTLTNTQDQMDNQAENTNDTADP